MPDEAAPPQIEVRRSARRRRTVSAYRDGDTVVVLLPARMTKADERHWITEMLRRLERSEQRRRAPRASDSDLATRAGQLSAQYLDGQARPTSVRWVPPMRTRWGSATPAEGTIRLSERLRDTPAWVVDYVLVHELAHLIEAGHTPAFWALVGRYPRTERAIGFLHGLSVAAGLGISGADGEPDVDANPDANPDPGTDAGADG